MVTSTRSDPHRLTLKAMNRAVLRLEYEQSSARLRNRSTDRQWRWEMANQGFRLVSFGSALLALIGLASAKPAKAQSSPTIDELLAATRDLPFSTRHSLDKLRLHLKFRIRPDCRDARLYGCEWFRGPDQLAG